MRKEEFVSSLYDVALVSFFIFPLFFYLLKGHKRNARPRQSDFQNDFKRLLKTHLWHLLLLPTNNNGIVLRGPRAR